MPVFIEDPSAVAAGFMTLPSGLQVRTTNLCPHGFPPKNACPCYLNWDNDPGLDGCAGREFQAHPPEEVVPELGKK